MPISLVKLRAREREDLVNRGYAVCDAALRRHLDSALEAAQRFPYPAQADAER